MAKILVVEDEVSLQKIIESKLKLEKFQVFTARDVEGAFQIIESEKIDFIWLDHYLLGTGTGLDIVTRVKSDPKLKSIPIFLISNTAGPDKISAYVHLGVDRYFVKSNVSLAEIISDLEEYFN